MFIAFLVQYNNARVNTSALIQKSDIFSLPSHKGKNFKSSPI